MDRLKFRYVFEKDFGGNTGLCYKMPVFDLDETVRTEFKKIIKGYTDYNYKLVSKDQCTGLKDKNGKLIYELDYVRYSNNKYKVEIDKFLGISLTNILNGDTIVMDDIVLFNCEVIGNEFESNTKI